MLQHFVFLRFVAGTTDSHIEEFCHRMQALRGVIPHILHLEIGRDILHDARSWDLILVMRFESVETLRIYQAHPAHQQVMRFNQAQVAEVGSIDYLAS